MSQSCAQKDLASRNVRWLVWGVPIVVIILGAFVGPILRTALWTPAFLVMGGACVYNAAHCGRLHCYITGPLFLIAAAATLLSGLGVVALDWRWIGRGAGLGTVLAYGTEWIRGKYVVRDEPMAAGGNAL